MKNIISDCFFLLLAKSPRESVILVVPPNRKNKSTFLQNHRWVQVDYFFICNFMFVQVEFSVSLLSQQCAYAHNQENIMVWRLIPDLDATITDGTLRAGFSRHKNSWKCPQVRINIQWFDWNCGQIPWTWYVPFGLNVCLRHIWGLQKY